MEPSKNQNTLAGSVIRVGVAAFFWILFVATLVYFVPGQKRTYDEFAMQPPAISQVVLNVSMWFSDFWWVAAPFMLIGLLVIAAITWLVRNQINNKTLAALWTLILLATPLLVNCLTWLGMLMARLKLSEALNR